jgi:hypothetical protein
VDYLDSVSCPTANFCAAVDEHGDVLAYSVPTTSKTALQLSAAKETYGDEQVELSVTVPRLNAESEKGAVAVEGPGSALPVERQLSFLRAVNDLFIDPASVGSEGEHYASRTCPARCDDSDRLAGDDTAHACAWCQLLKSLSFYTLDMTAFRNRRMPKVPGQRHWTRRDGTRRSGLQTSPHFAAKAKVVDMTSSPGDLHATRPSVYLDQWVWFRLAAAAKGKPRETGERERYSNIAGAPHCFEQCAVIRASPGH